MGTEEQALLKEAGNLEFREHMERFEVEPYRMATVDDARAGGRVALGLGVTEVVWDASLFRDSNNLVTVPLDTAASAIRWATDPAIKGIEASLRPQGMAGRSATSLSAGDERPKKQEQTEQQVVQPQLSPAFLQPASAPPLEYQLGGLAGTLALAAFAAAAVNSALRRRMTRRRILFRSGSTQEELEELYALPAPGERRGKD